MIRRNQKYITDAAEFLGMKGPTLHRIVYDQQSDVDLSTAIRICTRYGVSLEEFVINVFPGLLTQDNSYDKVNAQSKFAKPRYCKLVVFEAA